MSFKLLVGGYTTLITTLSFTPDSGAGSLALLSQQPGGNNPTWLALSPTNPGILYANQETDSGQIVAYNMDTNTGTLTQRSSGSSGAATSPAHFAVLNSGAEIIAANYGGGSIASLVLQSDRTLLPATPGNLVKFTGSGPDTARQAGPHPHQVYEYIDNQELLVPDLGSDRIWRIRRSATGAWEIGGAVTALPGSGPRHVQVHGDYLYTVNELTNMISQHTLPPLASGEAPQLVANLSTIPANTAGNTFVAEILLSPLNDMYPTRYLYVTNRGDADPAGDTIAIFSVNPLALVTHVRTGLKGIRGATIGGVNGEYLAVAGQNGGGVVVYRRMDGGSGLSQLARYSGNDLELPTTLVIVPDQASQQVSSTAAGTTRSATIATRGVAGIPSSSPIVRAASSGVTRWALPSLGALMVGIIASLVVSITT